MFEFLDGLAHWWIEHRVDQDIKELKKSSSYKELKLTRANFDSDGWSAELIHEDVAILAESAAEMLNRQNAKNYVQFIMYPRLKLGIRPIEVTVRWYYGGKTPAQKASELETEINAAKEFHPRAWKLIAKHKPFVVVANDEPYFSLVYHMIREHEIEIGRWNEEDERLLLELEKVGEP